MTINVEIICVGNELLIGKIKDINAHYLATQATKLGANVRRVTVIQDVIEEIATTINEAFARKPHFIITTGGLGPTFDDMTLQGLGRALNSRLAVNQEAFDMVKHRCLEYAKRRGLPTEIEMTPPRVKMATLPQMAHPVNNPIGTAPGAHVEVDGTALFVLPGVPAEMEAIFKETVAPLIRQAVGGSIFCERSIFTDNIMESRAAPLIDQVMRDNPGVYVKSHPVRAENKPHTELHLTMVATEDMEPEQKLLKAAKQLAALIEQNGGKVTV